MAPKPFSFPKPGRRHKSSAGKHNLAGSPGCEVMPQLLHPDDWVVTTKKRYDCFVGTDLDFTLRAHGVNALIVTGVNTNSCVLSTVAAACSKDYAVFVPSDCVDTMDDPALHDAALLCMQTAFAAVMPAEVQIGSSAMKMRSGSTWTSGCRRCSASA